MGRLIIEMRDGLVKLMDKRAEQFWISRNEYLRHLIIEDLKKAGMLKVGENGKLD